MVKQAFDSQARNDSNKAGFVNISPLPGGVALSVVHSPIQMQDKLIPFAFHAGSLLKRKNQVKGV